MTVDEPAVEVADVQVWTETGARLLDGIDWRVATGEHWAVLGPNGAGKTTLLSLLAGWRHPSAGAVSVLGRRLGHTDVHTLRRSIGWLGSTAAPPPGHLTVQTVALTGASGTVQPVVHGYGDTDRRRAAELLRQVGCEHLRDRRIGTCSDGERRRVQLARALMSRPRLMLLDEPAAGLDLPARETMVSVLEDLAVGDRTLTTITVTHHLEELPATTTHALLLRAGRGFLAGPVDAVLHDERLSECFGVALRVRRLSGRWTVHARRRPQTFT